MVDRLLGAIPISLRSYSLTGIGEGDFLIIRGATTGAGALPNLVFMCLGLTSSLGFFSVMGNFLNGDGSVFLGTGKGF